tara:strand:+ start:5256 stop:5732 length:477 start_codon:yes stop_codon:yes gene_type:complete
MTIQRNGTGRPGEMLTGDLEFFTAYSLVDVTDSSISDPNDADVDGYNQAQNLNVLLQTLGLRAQAIISSVTTRTSQAMADYSFGTDYTGNQTMWLVKFATEYKGAWAKDADLTYHLVQDCDSIAITTLLGDTAAITPKQFDTSNAAKKNLYFVRNDVI